MTWPAKVTQKSQGRGLTSCGTVRELAGIDRRMSTSSGSEETTWVQWFLSLKGHELMCEVHRSYIEDSFNLYGLRAVIPHYVECLNIILDRGEEESELEEKLQQHTFDLYGLIHSRYIVTARGLETMVRGGPRRPWRGGGDSSGGGGYCCCRHRRRLRLLLPPPPIRRDARSSYLTRH